MKQDTVEIVYAVAPLPGESRKAFRRRVRPTIVAARKDGRARGRANQRRGGAGERCTVRVEPIRTGINRGSKRTWRRRVRASAVATGRVGPVEWIVAPGGAMPSLNGYLVLPQGHPWLTPEGDDEWSEDFSYGLGAERAPREYTYRRGAWIGVDSAHYNDAWDTAELRARVKPFPRSWSRILTILPEWPLPSVMSDPYTTRWTVDMWTAAIREWARAAAGELHRLTGAEQIEGYPGGKNGFWIVRCTCGYSTGPRGKLGDANRSALSHLVDMEAVLG